MLFRKIRWKDRCLPLLGILTLLVSACDVTRKWTEEVQLKDGRVVIAQRASAASRFGEIGQSTGATKYWSIRLDSPEPLFWEGDITPIILELDSQYAYVVSRIVLTWKNCPKYDYPDPPFVFFRALRPFSSWERITAERLPDGLRMNLLQRVWTGSEVNSRKLLRVEDKLKLDRHYPLMKSGFDKSKPYASSEGCGEVKVQEQKSKSR